MGRRWWLHSKSFIIINCQFVFRDKTQWMQLIVRLILMDTHCCDLQSFTDIIYSNANEAVNHSRQSCPIKRGTNHPLVLAGPRGDPAERERRQETRPDDFGEETEREFQII